MRKTAFTYRILICAALALMLALGACAPVLAIDRFDAGQAVTLTVAFDADGTPAEGTQFSLYRVADMEGFGTFERCGEFAEYSVEDLNGLDSEGWRNMAGMLAGYAAADGIAADVTATTDAQGNADFGTLSIGLYLLTGESFAANGKIYTPQATLIALPGRDEDENWVYDVTVNVKPDVTDEETTDVEVMKVWDDGDYESRPGQVRVVLVGDGQIVDSATLDKTNNWRHTWTGLDANTSWQVVERPVPSGYTVSTMREDGLITITNRRPEDDDGGDGDGGGGGDSTLPQTGLVWWPVPVLAAAGMAMFAAGWLRRRKHED